MSDEAFTPPWRGKSALPSVLDIQGEVKPIENSCAPAVPFAELLREMDLAIQKLFKATPLLGLLERNIAADLLSSSIRPFERGDMPVFIPMSGTVPKSEPEVRVWPSGTFPRRAMK